MQYIRHLLLDGTTLYLHISTLIVNGVFTLCFISYEYILYMRITFPKLTTLCANVIKRRLRHVSRSMVDLLFIYGLIPVTISVKVFTKYSELIIIVLFT